VFIYIQSRAANATKVAFLLSVFNHQILKLLVIAKVKLHVKTAL